MNISDKYIIYSSKGTETKPVKSESVELTPGLWQEEMLELLSMYKKDEARFTPVKPDYNKDGTSSDDSTTQKKPKEGQGLQKSDLRPIDGRDVVKKWRGEEKPDPKIQELLDKSREAMKPKKPAHLVPIADRKVVNEGDEETELDPKIQKLMDETKEAMKPKQPSRLLPIDGREIQKKLRGEEKPDPELQKSFDKTMETMKPKKPAHLVPIAGGKVEEKASETKETGKGEMAETTTTVSDAEVDEVVKNRDGEVLKSGTVIKEDQFPGIHKLDPTKDKEPQERIPGAPNFRKVPGENTYGTGLPTEKALKEVLEKVGAGPDGDKTAVWTNLREEPVIYINGKNYTLRDLKNQFRNLDNPGASGADVEKTEEKFKKDILKEAAKNGGKILIREEVMVKDENGKEKPKVISKWVKVDENSVKTTKEVFDGLKEQGYKVDYKRIPISDEKRPEAKDFDELRKRIENVDPDTPVIFNCQAGRGRTTTALITAGLIRRAKEGKGDESITKHRSVRNRIKEEVDRNYRYDNRKSNEELDEEKYKRGDYKVILALIKMMEKGPKTKEEVDKLIDEYGSVQNLREAVLEQKNLSEKPGNSPGGKARKVEKGKNYLERYYYLILYNEYIKQYGPKFEKSFEDWTKENPQHDKVLKNMELAMGFQDNTGVMSA